MFPPTHNENGKLGTMFYLLSDRLMIETRTPSATGQCAIALGTKLSDKIAEILSPQKYPMIIEMDYDAEKKMTEVRFNQQKATQEKLNQAVILLGVIRDEIGEFAVRW